MRWLCVILMLAVTTPIEAGGRIFHGQRFFNQYGHCNVPVIKKPVYHAPLKYDVKKEGVTVVNNLIGVPVPVPYDKPIADQGNTVYGFTTAKDLIDPTDYGLFLSQANRLIESSGKLQAQAFASVEKFASEGKQGQQDIAEIIAAAEAIQRIRAGGGNKTTNNSVSVSVQAEAGAETDSALPEEAPASGPEEGGDFAFQLEQHIKTSCINCHNAQKASGGIDMTKYFAFDQAKLEKVANSISEGRMPLNAEGQPAPLPAGEKFLYLGYAYGR